MLTPVYGALGRGSLVGRLGLQTLGKEDRSQLLHLCMRRRARPSRPTGLHAIDAVSASHVLNQLKECTLQKYFCQTRMLFLPK